MISKRKNLSQAVGLQGHTHDHCPAQLLGTIHSSSLHNRETEAQRGSETWLRSPLRQPRYISVVTQGCFCLSPGACNFDFVLIH